MDAFFEGLDCRLRGSGMVADSIMMGIVNSAMENAYKKSCSKEGDLERLNEKSRFCELATMQLEWCLKYLQEVIDNSVTDGSCDREQLLSELLETRDRIHNRLEETELAIANKDVELLRRKENEIKLRLALEVKGEEVSSLHNALGLEKMKNEIATGSPEHHMFSELEKSLNQQIYKVRSRLEDGRQIVANLLQNARTSSLGGPRPSPGCDVNGDRVKTLHELHDMGQLKLDFEEMAMDNEVLKEEIRSSFQTILSSVSLFKDKMEENQWAWNVEKETVNLVTRNFLKDTQCQYVAALEDMSWPAFRDDFTCLHDELKALTSQLDVIPKSDGTTEPKIQRNIPPSGNVENNDNLEKSTTQTIKKTLSRSRSDGNYKIFDDYLSDTEKQEGLTGTDCKDGKSLNVDTQSQENQPGLVADLIKSHESIIRRKTQQINWLKGELNREKGRQSSIRNDRTFSIILECIMKVISRLESIQEKEKIVATSSRIGTPAHGNSPTTHGQNLSFSQTRVVQKEVFRTPGEVHEEASKTSCHHSSHVELDEEIRQMKEERFEMDIKAVLWEETYEILLKDGLKRMLFDCFDIRKEMLMREEMHQIICDKKVEQLNSNSRSITIGQHLKEPCNRSCCDLLHYELYEEIKQMKEDKTEMEMKVFILEDIYHILFRNTTRKMQCDFSDIAIDMLVRQDTYGCIIRDLVKEYSDQGELRSVMQYVKEEIDCIVFTNILKDLICAPMHALTRSHFKGKDTITELYQVNELGGNIAQAQKVEMNLNSFKLEKGFNSILISGPSDVSETKNSVDNNVQYVQLMSDKIYGYDSVKRNLETASCELQEKISSYPGILDDRFVICNPLSAMSERTLNSGGFPEASGDEHENIHQFIDITFQKFSQAANDFDNLVCERTRIYASRMDSLIYQFTTIIKQVNFVKKNESLYLKAFTRRCYDLQKAEAEVDLLGDEVDMLYSLVEKVYAAIYRYSPILQHYSGITDALGLMRKQLYGEVTNTSTQL